MGRTVNQYFIRKAKFVLEYILVYFLNIAAYNCIFSCVVSHWAVMVSFRELKCVLPSLIPSFILSHVSSVFCSKAFNPCPRYSPTHDTKSTQHLCQRRFLLLKIGQCMVFTVTVNKILFISLRYFIGCILYNLHGVVSLLLRQCCHQVSLHS